MTHPPAVPAPPPATRHPLWLGPALVVFALLLLAATVAVFVKLPSTAAGHQAPQFFLHGYGVLDATTEQGADPDVLAASILDRVVSRGETDFTIAAGLSATIGRWIRFLFPSLWQYLMVQRYEKSLLGKEKEE